MHCVYGEAGNVIETHEQAGDFLTSGSKKMYVKEAIRAMKKSIILIFALSISLALLSCSSERETTTTATRQTAATSVPPLLMTKTHTRSLSGQPAMDAGSY
jgi:hypothetical protein